MRFFNRLGATEVDPDTVCNKAGHVALDYVYGASETGFDPRTARDAACVVVWGANPSASAPHVDEHWLSEAPGQDDRRRPDPNADGRARRPASAAVSGQRRGARLRHARGRSGASGRLDRGFLRDHTVGWDELEPHLDGLRRRLGRGDHGRP